MLLIDTHAHIYLPEFDNDRELILQRAKGEGVEKIFMPAIDSTTHYKMLQVEDEFPGCYAMMGLHPCSVGEASANELGIVQQFLKERKFIAIGEIGLDFYWDKTFMQQQYDAFEKQIQWAIEYNLPVVIHSRNAINECIEVVKKYVGVKGVFHCFTGTADQARQIINAGFLLGIGGVITYKNAGLDKVINELGIKHLILETDAPYLSPIPYRGKRNESSYLPLIIEKIAAVSDKSSEEIAAVTTESATLLFTLS
jgi:TatD DNase family protein